MNTVWKVFHGSKEKGYKVAVMRLVDNGVLLAINREYIMLSAAELADLMARIDKVALGHAIKKDVERLTREEEEYRKKQQEKSEDLVVERFDVSG